MEQLTPLEVEQLQKEHAQLIDHVRRMRGYQIQWKLYHSSEDLKSARLWERRTDDIIKKHVEASKSKQGQIKF